MNLLQGFFCLQVIFETAGKPDPKINKQNITFGALLL